MAKKKTDKAGSAPRHYVLIIKTDDAPERFFPAGTLDDLRVYYRKKAEPFKAAPPALARIEATMQLYELQREPAYKSLDATLSQRFTNAAGHVRETASAILRDIPPKTLDTENMGEDLVEFGRHLFKAAQRKLSNGAQSGRMMMTSLRSEFQPELADGVKNPEGRLFVNSSWLVRNNNAARVPVSLLRDTPPAPGSAPRP